MATTVVGSRLLCIFKLEGKRAIAIFFVAVVLGQKSSEYYLLCLELLSGSPKRWKIPGIRYLGCNI